MYTGVNYTAIFYYEWHPTREGVYAIHVTFPDLMKIGLPASTVGNDPEDAIAAAKEVLEIVLEDAAERGIALPDPTPLEKSSLDRGLEHSGLPFKIELINISIENS